MDVPVVVRDFVHVTLPSDDVTHPTPGSSKQQNTNNKTEIVE